MNFIEAVECAEDGNKIKRLAWGYGHHTYITLEEFENGLDFMLNGQFSEHKYDNHELGKCVYEMSYEDVISNDWIIYE